MTIKPVKFDVHGSAKVRFFSNPVLLGFHFASPQTNVSIIRTACPESATKDQCKACENGVPLGERGIVTVWEFRHARWAILTCHPLVFKDVCKQCEELNVSAEKIAKGQGPDVLLQRTSNGIEVQVLPETLGIKAGLGTPPLMKSILETLGETSHWNTFNSLAELEAKFPRTT
jgi:hypothetical protein